MTYRSIDNRRIRFLNFFKEIASEINKDIFKNKYKTEVYFSGRDEDFIILEFKCDIVLIEVQIQLTNHLYTITGKEVIEYILFKLVEGTYTETQREHSFLFENNSEVLPFKHLLNKLTDLLNHF